MARRSASSSVWPARRAPQTKSSMCAWSSRKTSRLRRSDGIRAALTISPIKWPVRISFTRQDRSDYVIQMLPLPFVVARGLLSFGRQRIVFALAAIVAGSPLGCDEALLFKLMEGRVQSAFLECEGVRAAARGFLQDFVAVHICPGEQIQQQEADAALEEFAIDFHTWLAKPCIARYHVRCGLSIFC